MAVVFYWLIFLGNWIYPKIVWDKQQYKILDSKKNTDPQLVLRRITRKGEYIEPLHAFEQIVLKYFDLLIKRREEREKNIFQAFKKELLSLSDDQKKVLGFEDFLLWIDYTYFPSLKW